MRYTLAILLSTFVPLLLSGCSTENPLCTDTYCVKGEIFLKTDLEVDEPFDTLPATVDEQTLIDLLTVDVGEYDFESVTGYGKNRLGFSVITLAIPSKWCALP